MSNAALAGLLLAVSSSLLAADKEERVIEKKESTPVIVREEKVSSGDCNKCRTGHPIKNFWVHSVGGTIGNGLKKGASKISNTFD